MHAGNYCVAGWNATNGRMIRPLPGGSNWTGHLIAAPDVQPGATIRVANTEAQPNSIGRRIPRLMLPKLALSARARLSGLLNVAGALGFEPRITGPKPVALPLGHAPFRCR